MPSINPIRLLAGYYYEATMSRFSTRIRPNHRPTRTQSTRVLTSLSLVFFALIALICLCPVAVKAQDSRAAEYGDVIGIGEFLLFFFPLRVVRLLTHKQTWEQLTPAWRTFPSISHLYQILFSSSINKGGRIEIIANDQGHRITPSWVSFNGEERL
jgi:heat shock protein 5